MSHVIERTWTTEAGLKAVCLFVNDSHRCGYVAVPERHPLHGAEYSEETEALKDHDLENTTLGKRSPIVALTAYVGGTDGEICKSPTIAFDVHGGLTFSGFAYWDDLDVNWWFGFDCNHLGDVSLNDFSPDPSAIHKTELYVVNECEDLARQIVDMFPEEERDG